MRAKGETVEQYAAGVVNLVAGITERFMELLENCPVVAIEGVLAPNVWNNGDRVILHPQSVMDTCTVAGHIAGWATAERLEVDWVRPGHNGQGFMGAYPPELRPNRGKGAGKDRLRHMRAPPPSRRAAVLLADAACNQSGDGRESPALMTSGGQDIAARRAA